MNNGNFKFNLVDKFSPEVSIKKSLKQIEEATKGYVKGHIEKYDGPIYSYSKKVGLPAALSAWYSSSDNCNVNIQDELGALQNEQNRYEVFLSVKGLEYYKYRMMFVDYGTISYPVTIVMNDSLAIEYSNQTRTVFIIENMLELERMMDRIINSDTMISLIQNLINEALRKELTVEDIEIEY